MTITEILAGFYQPDYNGRRRPESLYGSLKMWAHLNREGIWVARCTIERLMGVNGWHRVTRTKKVRTTISDPAASRAPDLVDRQFKVGAPNQLVVADFTHVAMATASFAYTAFVIDAYADRIVGWECSTSKQTAFVESALRQAAAGRSRQGTPLEGSTIHHSDAKSQHLCTVGMRLFLGLHCFYPGRELFGFSLQVEESSFEVRSVDVCSGNDVIAHC
jgi:putative transposase